MTSHPHSDKLLRNKIARFEATSPAGLDKARAWESLRPRLRRRRPLLRYAAAALLLLAAGMAHFRRPGAPPAQAPAAANFPVHARPPARDVAGDQPLAVTQRTPSLARTRPAAARSSGNTPPKKKAEAVVKESRAVLAGQPPENEPKAGEDGGQNPAGAPPPTAPEATPAPRRLPVVRLHELPGAAGAAATPAAEGLRIRLPGGEGQPAVASSGPAGPLIHLPLNAKP